MKNIPKQSNTHFARNAKGLGSPEQMKSLMDVKKKSRTCFCTPRIHCWWNCCLGILQVEVETTQNTISHPEGDVAMQVEEHLSKKPENIRIIPGGVKNFAHSTIGFSRQSREEINFNCWKSTKAISTKDDRVQIQTDPPNPTWSGSLQPWRLSASRHSAEPGGAPCVDFYWFFRWFLKLSMLHVDFIKLILK